MGRCRLLIIVIACGCLLAAALIMKARTRTSPVQMTADIVAAIERRNLDEALRLSREAVRMFPEDGRVLLLAGSTARQAGALDEAIEFLDRIPEADAAARIQGRFASGQIREQLGRIGEAETCYREILTIEEGHAESHRRLAILLTYEGRRLESEEHLTALLQSGEFTVEELILLGNLSNDFDQPEELERYLEAVPEDPLPLLGLARTAIRNDDNDQAEEWLRQLASGRPDLIEAQAQLGLLLVQSGSSGFATWEAELPPEAEQHPRVWVARGLGSLERSRPREAVRCFWEAFQRDANDPIANYQLGTLLTAEFGDERGEFFLKRSAALHELSAVLLRLFFRRNRLRTDDIPDMRRAAILTEQLGRPWESSGWYRSILRIDPDLEWAQTEYNRLLARQDEIAERTDLSSHPELQVSLHSYPLPRFELSGEPGVVGSLDLGNVAFEDLAQASGIEFVYFNGHDVDAHGLQMFGVTGGGVAALDYDADLWPDVYLTQGCEWPVDEEPREYMNRLFRNLGNGTFRDATERTGLGDIGFGQGVSVGDFNDDGFADVLVANIGGNRLYRNNGDGTFTDVWRGTGLPGSSWTTSCAIADLNGDGFPDVYEVNYLEGQDLFERMCHSDGRPHACPPQQFEAAQDRLLINQGDGRFEDATSTSGIAVPNGKGMGLVVADLDGTGSLSVFVGNDTTENFYFRNTAEPGRGERLFEESAMLFGLAFDRMGLAQACMGIAADDPDGDGRVDLFITNYYDQSNVFYQNRGSVFEDTTNRCGLREPGFKMLGFGTQFLDADLDGWPDLIVANGHVDDFSHQGAAYRMPMQFLRNLGEGRFVDVEADTLGEYFQRPLLGRGLGKLDWNRDGREDVVVSFLETPAALLTNTTVRAGHFLSVRLIGVDSSRDAIGATVRLEAGGRVLIRQLTAGDGYQASNQRQLVFGLGESLDIDRMVVQWPSGAEQTFQNLSGDVELLVVEGVPAPFALPAAGIR